MFLKNATLNIKKITNVAKESPKSDPIWYHCLASLTTVPLMLARSLLSPSSR